MVIVIMLLQRRQMSTVIDIRYKKMCQEMTPIADYLFDDLSKSMKEAFLVGNLGRTVRKKQSFKNSFKRRDHKVKRQYNHQNNNFSNRGKKMRK